MRSHPYIDRINQLRVGKFLGHVNRIATSHLESDGPYCTVGDICEITNPNPTGQTPDGSSKGSKVMAEVTSVEKQKVVLVPFGDVSEIYPDASVRLLPRSRNAGVGMAYGGRLLDSLGRPMDKGHDIFSSEEYPLHGQPLRPLERSDPEEVLATGIRAIDGLLTLGKGQRVGVFAASGVGKTTLIAQLATQVNCDRVVTCLVGERGREVEALWRLLAGREDSARFTCVAATSDLSPTLRARAVHQALCLAEYWRDQGEHVLVIIDSITRYAMALREIGLAEGAPPTLRAYTPNVFDALPRVVERGGAAKSGGAISMITTVLSETDDVDDPIVEVMKSLLDGHIVLSRSLAEQGHFPAIDISKSVSRQSESLMEKQHLLTSRQISAFLSKYEESRILIESGIYKAGSDPLLDKALASRDNVMKFLAQDTTENIPFGQSVSALGRLASPGGSFA